ncbi:hypothetical protein ACHAWF_002938 [Thalassiosira exigua]
MTPPSPSPRRRTNALLTLLLLSASLLLLLPPLCAAQESGGGEESVAESFERTPAPAATFVLAGRTDAPTDAPTKKPTFAPTAMGMGSELTLDVPGTDLDPTLVKVEEEEEATETPTYSPVMPPEFKEVPITQPDSGAARAAGGFMAAAAALVLGGLMAALGRQ